MALPAEPCGNTHRKYTAIKHRTEKFLPNSARALGIYGFRLFVFGPDSVFVTRLKALRRTFEDSVAAANFRHSSQASEIVDRISFHEKDLNMLRSHWTIAPWASTAMTAAVSFSFAFALEFALPVAAQDFVITDFYGVADAKILFHEPGFPNTTDHDEILPMLDTLAFAEVQASIGGVFDGRAAAFQSLYGINATFVEVTGFPPELTTGYTVTADTSYEVEFESTSNLTGRQIPFEFVINSGELRIEDFARFEPFGSFGGAFVQAEIDIDGFEWVLDARLTKDEVTGLPLVTEGIRGNQDDFGLNIHPTLVAFMDGTDAVVSIPRISGTVLVDGSEFRFGQRFDYDMHAELEMVQLTASALEVTGGLAGITDPFALGTPDDPSDDLGPPFSPLGVQFFLDGHPLSDFPVQSSGVDGDFNDDGLFDCLDVDALVAEIAMANNSGSFDMTGDGQVDADDLSQWLADAGSVNLASGNPFLPGDANLDGSVEVADFNIWNTDKFTDTAAWCRGDFTADGSVDISDFNVWNTHKFLSADTSAVPEPTAVWLVGWVLLAVGWRR